MLHNKHIGYSDCGLGQEQFKRVLLYNLYGKQLTPRAVQSLTQGHDLGNLGRGPLCVLCEQNMSRFPLTYM